MANTPCVSCVYFLASKKACLMGKTLPQAEPQDSCELFSRCVLTDVLRDLDLLRNQLAVQVAGLEQGVEDDNVPVVAGIRDWDVVEVPNGSGRESRSPESIVGPTPTLAR